MFGTTNANTDVLHAVITGLALRVILKEGHCSATTTQLVEGTDQHTYRSYIRVSLKALSLTTGEAIIAVTDCFNKVSF